MSQAPLNKVDQIRQDLACPNCKYNLRGLSGVLVTCPECGQGINIAHLVARKWTGSWYRAPGFNRLIYPLAGLIVFGLIAFLFSTMPGRGNMVAMFSGVALLSWVALIVLVTVRDGIEGVALSLLGHLVFGGYIGGLIMFLVGGIGTINAVMSFPGGSSLNLLLCISMFLISIALVVLAHIGERFIAKRCISRYLKRKPKE